jgi:AcrR family transcriptional regulator
MAESAIHRRGRRTTELRIVDAAQRLADERGSIDGFTMDELAVAADVSRRTLFNYFPSKVDAVMGPDLVIPPDALRVFVEEGPSGDLIDDLQALVLAILHDEVVEADSIARFDRLIHANPVLLATMKQRFHRLAERVVDAAVDRSVGAVPARDAQIAVAVLAGLADVAISDYLEDPRLDFADLYVSAIASVRRLFG